MKGTHPGTPAVERSRPVNVPDSVTTDYARWLYEECNGYRRELKAVGDRVDALRRSPHLREPSLDIDVGANIALAFRSIEESSMRLGKALQALDGGVSVYDKGTTVGAPP